MPPKVSIVITVYNGMPFIKDTIDSLITQTYQNFEVIIVDDGSVDDTPDYLASLTDTRIKVISENRIGRGRSLNLAIKNSNGKYIAINDADDISYPTRLEKQVEFLEKNKEYGLVGSHSIIKNYDTGEIRHHKRPIEDADIRKFFTIGQPIQHVTALILKSVIESIGGYNEQISFLFDREIFLRIAKVSKVYNLEEELVIVGQHGNRYFEGGFKGFKREYFSLKYRIKAISIFNYPKSWIIREILRSIWSFTPHVIRQFIIKQIKKLK